MHSVTLGKRFVMRKYFPLITALILLAVAGCKKDDDTTNPAPVTTSQWTFRGTTYTGLATLYDTSVFSILTSSDAAGHYANVTFYTRPAPTGVYTVTDGIVTTATSCVMNVYDGTEIYTSTGAAGNTVALTIAGTHVTAVFNNVTVKGTGAATYMFSGTLYK